MSTQFESIIGVAFMFVVSSFSVFAQTDTSQMNIKSMSFGEKIEYIKNMEILDVHPDNVPDGSYIGEFLFTGDFVYSVSVEVKAGKMRGIDVLNNGTGNSYAQNGLTVIDQILKEQSPKVDAVSGSTITSKSLMKCVEEVLKNNTERKREKQ